MSAEIEKELENIKGVLYNMKNKGMEMVISIQGKYK